MEEPTFLVEYIGNPNKRIMTQSWIGCVFEVYGYGSDNDMDGGSYQAIRVVKEGKNYVCISKTLPSFFKYNAKVIPSVSGIPEELFEL
jgi:hypothetical protein